MSKDTLYFETNGFERFRSFVFSSDAKQPLYLLADENTYRDCFPLVRNILEERLKAHCIIPAGEIHKNLNTLTDILTFLTQQEAPRGALLINLGGGMVTDIGGFAAAIYKRGISYVNLPTSLLAQIDASIGGKTGIDFMGFKNQIGSFYPPKATFIATEFLNTLPQAELNAGKAEAWKHALVADADYWTFLKKLQEHDFAQLVERSVAIKSAIVAQDPLEKNVRKKLNFGHTIGHAVESYFLEDIQQPILHGEAVGIGLICETHIAWQKKLISKSTLDEVVDTLKQFYCKFELPKTALQTIIKRMYHDKKNTSAHINFTLLNGIGEASIDHVCDEEMVHAAFVFYSTL